MIFDLWHQQKYAPRAATATTQPVRSYMGRYQLQEAGAEEADSRSSGESGERAAGLAVGAFLFLLVLLLTWFIKA